VVLRNLYRMGIFVHVVESRSFTRAAASLELGKSVVSQHVKTLEEELGMQLLHRNTRSLALTDEGRGFYEHCRAMLDAAETALAGIAAARHEPRGVLRVTAPLNLGTSPLLVETIRAYRHAYPEVEVELRLEDAIVDLVAEGYDLALRVGWLSDSSLVARRLAPFRLLLAATPAYLEAHGAPRRPPDLLQHDLIGLSGLSLPNRFELTSLEGRRVTLKAPPKIAVNTGIASRQLALAGLGIAVLPDYAVQVDFEEGALAEVLPDWRMKEGSISAVFPHREGLAPRTRVFVEMLDGRFRADASD
jgi:DNA-binding transcriptional LysR family regulator